MADAFSQLSSTLESAHAQFSSQLSPPPPNQLAQPHLLQQQPHHFAMAPAHSELAHALGPPSLPPAPAPAPASAPAGPSLLPDNLPAHVDGEPDLPAGHSPPDALPPSAPATPVKRKPGRPKGSGKKADPDAPPKAKRPVGRPRKDGLPAGSVGPRKPARARKAPPGQFANVAPVPAPVPAPPPPQLPPAWAAHPWAGVLAGVPPVLAFAPTLPLAPPPPAPPAFAETSSAGARANIDPRLLSADWADLLRSDPDALLESVVAAVGAPVLPASARAAFGAHVASLAPNPATLYETLRTFWVPTSPAWFVLTVSADRGEARSADRFFYWDPLLVLALPALTCTACGGALRSQGPIAHGARTILDLGPPVFVIGAAYACARAGCGRVCASTDGAVMRALPASLRAEFPARLCGAARDRGAGPGAWDWAPAGVSHALWALVRGALGTGANREAIVQTVRGIVDAGPDERVLPPAPAPPAGSQKTEEQEPLALAPVFPPAQTQSAEAEVEAALQATPNTFTPALSGSPLANATQNGESVHATPAPQTPAVAPSQLMQAGSPTPAGLYAFPAGMYQPPMSAAAIAALAGGGSASPSASSPPAAGGAKRTYDRVMTFETPGASPAKRARHCCKCGSHDCKGKGGRGFCPNACQDCGRTECKGRNSKRPDKTCADAWA